MIHAVEDNYHKIRALHAGSTRGNAPAIAAGVRGDHNVLYDMSVGGCQGAAIGFKRKCQWGVMLSDQSNVRPNARMRSLADSRQLQSQGVDFPDAGIPQEQRSIVRCQSEPSAQGMDLIQAMRAYY